MIDDDKLLEARRHLARVLAILYRDVTEEFLLEECDPAGIARALGAAPIMLALSETYPALQVGVLDATVASMRVTGDLVRSGGISSITWSDEFSPFLYATVLITSEDIGANFGGGHRPVARDRDEDLARVQAPSSSVA